MCQICLDGDHLPSATGSTGLAVVRFFIVNFAEEVSLPARSTPVEEDEYVVVSSSVCCMCRWARLAA